MQFVATAISCVSRDRLAPAGEEAHTRRVHKPRNEHPFRATNFSALPLKVIAPITLLIEFAIRRIW